jgi:cyclophilin family peptidyl-prolyl cis-trans isomerase
MKTFHWTGLCLITLLAACGGGGGGDDDEPTAPTPDPQVTVTVSDGSTQRSFVITLSPTQAPVTVANFLSYVRSGWYNGIAFHRHAPGFVLQGGGYVAPLGTSALPAAKAASAPIALEVGRGLSNTRYTVAMARTNVLNSATSEFYVNLANNSFLDTSGGGYAVFGQVTSGTDVIDAFQTAPCVATLWLAAGECLPTPNLVIVSAVQTR